MKKTILLALMLVTLYLLHQDFWNWKSFEPLVFGFLPIGLAYHVGYSIVASVAMVVLVRFAWPRHLDEDEQPKSRKQEETP